MCGRFTLTDSIEKIIFSFGLSNSKLIFSPRYNLYPSETVPVIMGKKGFYTLELMKWGLENIMYNSGNIQN